MIVKEYIKTRKDGVEIYRRYSNLNKYIIQQETGLKFSSADDAEPCKYTYTETDIDIETINSEENLSENTENFEEN